MEKGINGNALKLLAIVTMIIDHIGFMFFAGQWNLYVVCRIIGRLAFPIFCFLLVEGFVHTRNIKKYAVNLLIFGFISEIPFDMAFFRALFVWEYQNVYFTLFIGLLVLAGLKQYSGNVIKQAIVLIAGCAASMIVKSDYQLSGIILISGLYLLRESKLTVTIFGIIFTLFESISFYGAAALAFIPICMYNGKRGKWKLKYLFYWFYPIHLAVLYMLLQILKK